MNKKKKKTGGFAQGLREQAERMKRMNGEEEKTCVNTEEAQETAQEAAEETTQEAAPAQDVQKLAEQLAKAEKEREEYLDLAQRTKAEFINYKRRTESTRAEAYADGSRETVKALLPVIDNLERALQAAGTEESPLANGVAMTLKQLMEALAKMGVEGIDPMGQPFDANLHNAVMQGSAEDGEPGTVCMVLQKGYSMGGKVIRHAMVKVVAG